MADARALFDAAEELYSASLDAFTPTRNARAAAARKAGDRELAADVTALRKPSAPAWASNMLFRSSPRIVGELADLRGRISTASAAGDREALRESASSRHALVARLVEDALTLVSAAGKPLSPSATDDLVEAFTAALGDADVAGAMATGRLISPPRTGGMSRSDLAEIVALPPDALTHLDADGDDDGTAPAPSGSSARRTGKAPSARGGRAATSRAAASSSGPSAAERRRHERELQLAEERADDARADRDTRQRRRDESARARDSLADEVSRQRDALTALERRLDDAENDVDARTADIRSRELEWKRTENAARSARRVVDEDRASDSSSTTT